ncbi:Outer membrane protein H precursor [Nitrospira tepida]|uniref:Outer membrane protein H n=1 Tax=Nitrospira tepida TaxID=2973512 RepID=A0AA86N105_9BACT|nr:OmpH family outer membrane protein [Nitrospira tepida]CAI4032712.1 Outer membrane protein H precursor [Nitrospira tepida]
MTADQSSHGLVRRKWVAAGAGVLAVVGAMLCWTAGAMGAESFSVAVVNQQTVMDKSKTGQRAIEELKTFSATRQKIVSSDEEELKELEKVLQDGTLKDEQKQEKQNLFRAKLDAYQRRVQDFNREIQQKQKELFEQYSKKISEAALKVAQRRGFAAVLDTGTEASVKIVIYANRSVDITDEVIKEFDRQFKP